MNINASEKSSFIWKIADLFRGDYKQSEYGDVILPFTVLCFALTVCLRPRRKKFWNWIDPSHTRTRLRFSRK